MEERTVVLVVPPVSAPPLRVQDGLLHPVGRGILRSLTAASAASSSPHPYVADPPSSMRGASGTVAILGRRQGPPVTPHCKRPVPPEKIPYRPLRRGALVLWKRDWGMVEELLGQVWARFEVRKIKPLDGDLRELGRTPR